MDVCEKRRMLDFCTEFITSILNQSSPLCETVVNHSAEVKERGYISTYSNYMAVIAGVYCILFLVGICGNTSVLSVVLYIKSVLKTQLAAEKENAFIFLIALCLVDSLVILSLPMTITNLLLGHWLFGSYMCKFYWLMESAGKVTSTFVLAAWSFERYMAVCRLQRLKLRGNSMTAAFLLVLGALALLLLIPLPYSAKVVVMPVPGPGQAVPFAGTYLLYTTRCTTSMMDPDLFMTFTTYIFILGYCIPLTLMIIFYTKVLLRIRYQKQALKQSKIPLKRVTLYTVALISFYFICYTPYWFGTMLLFLVREVQSEFEVYLMYAIHALPYVNSGFNFVFYALLNSQMRNRKHEVITILSRVEQTDGGVRSRFKLSSMEGVTQTLSPSRAMVSSQKHHNQGYRSRLVTAATEYTRVKESNSIADMRTPQQDCSLEKDLGLLKPASDVIEL